MDTTNAVAQLEAMASDLLSLHEDALGLEVNDVAHKAWHARQAVMLAKFSLARLDAACVSADV